MPHRTKVARSRFRVSRFFRRERLSASSWSACRSYPTRGASGARRTLRQVARATHHGTSLVSLGALLGGTGACLVVLGVLLDPGVIWGGRSATPAGRLSEGAELVGSMLVATGALILLVASSLTASIIVIVVAGAALLTYGTAIFRLRKHLADVGDPRSWWWCLRHPLWRPS